MKQFGTDQQLEDRHRERGDWYIAAIEPALSKVPGGWLIDKSHPSFVDAQRKWEKQKGPLSSAEASILSKVAHHRKLQQSLGPVPDLKWPAWARKLAELAVPEDKGVGDIAQRYAAKAGGEWFKKLMKSIGINCGCTDRQKWMNERYPLPGPTT